MEETDDQNESTERFCFSFRCRREPRVRSGRWPGWAGKLLRCGPAAGAVPQPKLLSRARFRAALSGTALRLEHRQGQVKDGRRSTIAPALGELKAVRKHPGSPPLIQQATAVCLTGPLICARDRLCNYHVDNQSGHRIWWAHKGSNLGPLPCEGNALPLSYAPGIFVNDQRLNQRRIGFSAVPEPAIYEVRAIGVKLLVAPWTPG